jgi:hypothetical protein
VAAHHVNADIAAGLALQLHPLGLSVGAVNPAPDVNHGTTSSCDHVIMSSRHHAGGVFGDGMVILRSPQE